MSEANKGKKQIRKLAQDINVEPEQFLQILKDQGVVAENKNVNSYVDDGEALLAWERHKPQPSPPATVPAVTAPSPGPEDEGMEAGYMAYLLDKKYLTQAVELEMVESVLRSEEKPTVPLQQETRILVPMVEVEARLLRAGLLMDQALAPAMPVVPPEPERITDLGIVDERGAPTGLVEPSVPAFKTVAEVMAETGLNMEEVLIFGEIPGRVGSFQTRVDPDLVEINRQADIRRQQARSQRRAELAVSEQVTRDRMVTSSHIPTNVDDRAVIDMLTETALRFIQHTANGAIFRPIAGEVRALARETGKTSGELFSFPNDRVPANYTVVAYEYLSPIRAGWTIRLKPTAYTGLRADRQQSFPIYTQPQRRVMLAELASLSIAPETCAACEQKLDQGFELKLNLLLQGRQYLRGKGDETRRVLKELGIDPDDPKTGLRGELFFRRTHTACKPVLPIMAPIADAFEDRPLNDPVVKEEFLDQVFKGIRRNYPTIKLDPKMARVTYQDLLKAAADIADVLIPDQGDQR